MLPIGNHPGPTASKSKNFIWFPNPSLLFSPAIICCKPCQQRTDHLGCIKQNGIMCKIFGVGCAACPESGGPRGRSEGWRRSWVGETEEVRERNTHLLAGFFSLSLTCESLSEGVQATQTVQGSSTSSGNFTDGGWSPGQPHGGDGFSWLEGSWENFQGPIRDSC